MQPVAQSSRAGGAELTGAVAVATHRSFRRAAASLGLSPSALSHAVAALEARLGVRLFHRTTRSVSLTEAGERFLGRVRPALREIESAMEAVNDFRDTPAGLLRITTSEVGAQLIFAKVIVPFLARHPDMQVEVVAEGRLVDIVAEGFDAGIRLRESVPRDMIALPLGPVQRFAVVGSRRYFARHPAPRAPADLAQHACIRNRTPSGAIFRWELDRRGEEATLDVKGPLTIQGAPSLVLRAVLAGVGLGYVNESAVTAHIASGRLVRVLEDWTPPFAGLCLYFPHHRVSAGLRAFIAQVRKAFPADEARRRR